jgi:hypothetical protein
LLPDFPPGHILSRGRCRDVGGFFVKDLAFLGSDLSGVLIVDKSPMSFCFQPRNGILIPPWTGPRRRRVPRDNAASAGPVQRGGRRPLRHIRPDPLDYAGLSRWLFMSSLMVIQKLVSATITPRLFRSGDSPSPFGLFGPVDLSGRGRVGRRCVGYGGGVSLQIVEGVSWQMRNMSQMNSECRFLFRRFLLEV